MSNSKYLEQKLRNQHNKINFKKSQIKNKMIINIQHYRSFNVTYRLENNLILDKSKHKLGLKYFSYPELDYNTPPKFIFINVDIIDNDYSSKNILKIVKNNNNCEIICDNPNYCKLNDSYINKIKISYLDENGNYIKFKNGYLILVLEIIEI